MNKKEVLVIEDDEWIRNALRMILTFKEYPVTTAIHGQDALSKLESIPKPGLIIVDLMMPVMDGWAFAEAVNQDKRYKDIPLVVLTAFGDKSGTVKNASHHLTKPVDFKSLLELVEQHCAAS